jgi:hypothetical protein
MNNEYPRGTPFFFLKTNWRISAGLMKDNRSLIRKKNNVDGAISLPC